MSKVASFPRLFGGRAMTQTVDSLSKPLRPPNGDEDIYAPEHVERRLTLMELESAIIAATNQRVALQANLARIEEHIAELQHKVVEAVQNLGIKAEVVRSS
jgi:hypothetical protein